MRSSFLICRRRSSRICRCRSASATGVLEGGFSRPIASRAARIPCTASATARSYLALRSRPPVTSSSDEAPEHDVDWLGSNALVGQHHQRRPARSRARPAHLGLLRRTRASRDLDDQPLELLDGRVVLLGQPLRPVVQPAHLLPHLAQSAPASARALVLRIGRRGACARQDEAAAITTTPKAPQRPVDGIPGASVLGRQRSAPSLSRRSSLGRLRRKGQHADLRLMPRVRRAEAPAGTLPGLRVPTPLAELELHAWRASLHATGLARITATPQAADPGRGGIARPRRSAPSCHRRACPPRRPPDHPARAAPLRRRDALVRLGGRGPPPATAKRVGRAAPPAAPAARPTTPCAAISASSASYASASHRLAGDHGLR